MKIFIIWNYFGRERERDVDCGENGEREDICMFLERD